MAHITNALSDADFLHYLPAYIGAVEAELVPRLRRIAQQLRETEHRWEGQYSTGVAGPAVYDTEEAALARYKTEKAVPSYMGPGHVRHVQVVKVSKRTELVRDA